MECMKDSVIKYNSLAVVAVSDLDSNIDSESDFHLGSHDPKASSDSCLPSSETSQLLGVVVSCSPHKTFWCG
jgi:hypothetical protein